MGDNPNKLLGFIKAVDKEQPDIIALQEVGNKVLPIKGYNYILSPSAETASQHGAAIYAKTYLGQPTNRHPRLANIVHLAFQDLDFEIINMYIAPLYGKGMYTKYIKDLFNREKHPAYLILGDLNQEAGAI